MSKQQSKLTIQEGLSKVRLPSQKISDKVVTGSAESKKRTMSVSLLGALGARMIFFKRGDKFKIPRYQNTYRLESFHPFHVEEVDKILHDVMENKLSGVASYQPTESSKLCLEITADVQKAIGKKDFDRYKIVVQVNIVQRLHQSVHAAFQCLWDAERDNYSYHVFENSHIYAWCCAYGIYYE